LISRSIADFGKELGPPTGSRPPAWLRPDFEDSLAEHLMVRQAVRNKAPMDVTTGAFSGVFSAARSTCARRSRIRKLEMTSTPRVQHQFQTIGDTARQYV
jgi:hypothetical protein